MPRSRKWFEKLIKPIKRRRPKQDIKEIVAEQGWKEFSFETLSSATESFDCTNKLGEGGFGEVYKGKLNDGREIAVKRPLQISDKGKELVLNELTLLLKSAHHRNIVKFLGYCSHRKEILLVFEFARNGSLEYHLFNSETGRTDALEWNRTYDIIVGVARALLYLHEQSHRVIIHCDIKPANILLDENWVPKIADFGTACFLPQDQTHVCISNAAVTFGYSAPEYVSSGHVSLKADTYSFGVVVLELISSKKNWLSHSRSSNGQGLRDRAKQLYKEGKVSEFMDQKLIPSVVLDQVQLCGHIGIMSTEYDPELRPTMGRVYSMLSENHSSSTLVEEPMRDGSSSAIDRPLIHSRQIQPKFVQSSIANNGSSYGADIHLENKDLPKHRRRPFQLEDLQSYIASIPSSACSSSGNGIQIEPEEGPVQAATQQVAAAAAEEEEEDEGIQQQTVEEEADKKHRTTLNDIEEQPVNSTPEDRVIMPEIKVDKERLAAADAKDCWLAFTKLKSSETSFKKSLNDEGNESSWCEDECFER